MSFIMSFVKDVLAVPAVLLGLSALVGLIAASRSLEEVITGTVKSILGFVILGGGAGILIGSLDAMGPLLEAGFGVKGVVPNNEAIGRKGRRREAGGLSLIWTQRSPSVRQALRRGSFL